VGHQIFVNGFFRLNYEEAQVNEALRSNTTVQEIRIGTLPFEANSGASIFHLMVSNNTFIRADRPRFPGVSGSYAETEVLSVGARSIWGNPRMRVFADERAIAGGMPIAVDLSVAELRRSTSGVFTEVRVSGVYTAFPDLARTDPVNTPLPTVTQPSPPIPMTYTVQAGDTLWLLAQRFGASVERLMEWNGLTHTVLHIGQTLQIPLVT